MIIKKRLRVFLAILCLALMIVTARYYILFNKNKIIHIAVAGPMSGNLRRAGEAMLKGIRLYIQDFNTTRRRNDPKIKLSIFDDKADKSMAMRAANQIIQQNKALIVLGHLDSPSSAAAGQIYKIKGIPAITASASNQNITSNNDWYFRIIPNNHFITSFILLHIKRSGQSKLNVIFDKDVYGRLLVNSLEAEAKRREITITNKWGFNKATFDRDLRKIIDDVRAMDDPGVFFCSTHPLEGAKIVASLKGFFGNEITILGPPSFSGASFIKHMNSYPAERLLPGYYSDGTVAISPFNAEMGGVKTNKFLENYKKTYNEKPSWVSAFYYDAMHVAVEAITLAEIGKQDPIYEKRRKIRDTLARVNSEDVAIHGVTGETHFNYTGDVTKPMVILVYAGQKPQPAFSQYQSLRGQTVFKKGLGSQIVVIDGKVMTETKIIHTGIDINEISGLDMDKKTFDMDFYIWFRSEGKMASGNITFMNAVNPVKLERPIMETRRGNLT